MKNTYLLTLILIASLLSACAPENTISPRYSLQGGLQAWVDAPLEGTILILPVSYNLVCHGSDPSGVQALEFSINEQVLATLPNPNSSATLFNAFHQWVPDVPGTYTVRCRTRNSSGEWGEYAMAQVLLVEAIDTITPTPSSTPTQTATPTITLTPIRTTTPTVTPSSTGAAITFTSNVSTNIFQYQRDCVPNPGQVTITAKLSNTVGVKTVYLFFRLESSALGITTEWNSGVPMVKGTSGYSRTIAWDGIPQLSQIKWSSSVFTYQFVVVDQNEAIIARSQRFRDITLEPCR